jgi:hypothetical protein
LLLFRFFVVALKNLVGQSQVPSDSSCVVQSRLCFGVWLFVSELLLDQEDSSPAFVHWTSKPRKTTQGCGVKLDGNRSEISWSRLMTEEVKTSKKGAADYGPSGE